MARGQEDGQTSTHVRLDRALLAQDMLSYLYLVNCFMNGAFKALHQKQGAQ